MTSSLAWPVAVVLVGLTYRKTIRRWFDRPPAEINVGSFGIKWAEGVEEIESSFEGDVSKGESSSGKETPLSVSLRGLAKDRPGTAVFEASKTIELRLADIVREIESVPQKRARGLAELINLAEKGGKISTHTATAIHGLRELRNLAVHGSNEISETQAWEYIALADAVLLNLNRNQG